MRFLLKSGYLYPDSDSKAILQIKSVLCSQEKRIHLIYREGILKTEISVDKTVKNTMDVRNKQYLLKDWNGALLLSAQPGYAEGEAPASAGWSLLHLPKVDKAAVRLDEIEYTLVMRNGQHYSLLNAQGETVLRILHRGLAGGWGIDTAQAFTPEIVSAVFLFARYLEQENEFPVV